MFCPKCGNEVPEGSGFCGKCGHSINPQRAGSTQPIQENQVSDGDTVESSSKEAAPAKKKKKSKIIVPIVAVLLVAVIGVAAAFATDGFGLLGDSDTESSDSIETSSDVEESGTSTEADNDEEAEDAESDESDDGIKDSVDDYTWEELSAISAEIAAASSEDEAIEIAKTYNLVNEDGTLDGTQTKSVRLTDGTVTSVQIAGFVHDDKSDGSGKAGITFIFTDTIAEMSISSDGYSTGGWESSKIRSWLASDGKALLPEELQDVIVAVDKSTNNVGYVENADDVSSIVTATSDELWLFSLVELVGEIDEDLFPKSKHKYQAAIYNAEGFQYKLFSDCDVSISGDNDILKKATTWWERSPELYYSTTFLCVGNNGWSFDGVTANARRSVVPGFCI